MNKQSLIIVCLLLFALALSSLAIAEPSYYADISITVDEAGLTSISGNTNHENLSVENSPLYTSKEGAYWVFRISPEGVFENAIYEINLPKGSSVTYMKLPSFSRVETTGDGLTLVGTAQNQLLNLTVQYEILDVASDSSLPPWWFVAIIGLLISAGVVFLKKKFSKKQIVSNSPASNSSNSKYASSSDSPSSDLSSKLPLSEQRMNKYLPSLSDRQKELITLIKHSKTGSITQAELERITGFPKSSLSRNVDSLVRKELIEKKQTGMSNTLCLKID